MDFPRNYLARLLFSNSHRHRRVLFKVDGGIPFLSLSSFSSSSFLFSSSTPFPLSTKMNAPFLKRADAFLFFHSNFFCAQDQCAFFQTTKSRPPELKEHLASFIEKNDGLFFG